ncbi:hypothetical protein D9613_008123 [Agrocybe pediades]|uniref:Protein kinase domain-containing protein n=1 Tax=Agrocybe pediades TaxID=84607 RepID=A0A8H4QM24_9AGAR|nr:hypothetical protein D9613_008123 [Agrocybe pediades]
MLEFLRDMCWGNLMLDTSKTIPNGHHFSDWSTEDGLRKPIQWKERWKVRPNQYHIIDFGISVRCPPEATGVVGFGVWGQDRSVPEMTGGTAVFDPFKTDIYQLGNVFKQCIERYDGLGRFSPLADWMTSKDPAARPTISEAVQMCKQVIRKTERSWRMSKRIWRADASAYLQEALPLKLKLMIEDILAEIRANN